MGVGDKVLGAESHFLMGRVMPRDFLKIVGEYLDQAAPARKEEMIDAIKTRAEELVDAAGTGAMALGAVVLAAFETLLPLFDGDERRTILLLQHAMGPILRRPYELMFDRLSKKDQPLDAIQRRAAQPRGYTAAAGTSTTSGPSLSSSR